MIACSACVNHCESTGGAPEPRVFFALMPVEAAIMSAGLTLKNRLAAALPLVGAEADLVVPFEAGLVVPLILPMLPVCDWFAPFMSLERCGILAVLAD